MDRQIALPEKSLSIIVGPPPSLDELPKIKSCFVASDGSAASFRQVVTLSTQNLVQLCNFTRRCRKERDAGKQYKYLVLFHFLPHQEAWHLLTVFREFELTVVLFGGVCTEYAIREVFEYGPCCVAEWYQRKLLHGKPMLCARYGLTGGGGGGVVGILRMFGAGISSVTGDIDGEVNATLREWAEKRSPETFSAMRFHSMEGYRRSAAFGSGGDSSSRPSSSSVPRNAHATATMSIKRACELLSIDESQCTNEAAVRKAYLIKAVKFHPDKQKTDEERAVAHGAFTQVGEARRYLDELIERQSRR